jgi:hypothetical protein
VGPSPNGGWPRSALGGGEEQDAPREHQPDVLQQARDNTPQIEKPRTLRWPWVAHHAVRRIPHRAGQGCTEEREPNEPVRVAAHARQPLQGDREAAADEKPERDAHDPERHGRENRVATLLLGRQGADERTREVQQPPGSLCLPEPGE